MNHRFVSLLSLVATPLLLCVSNTLSLYRSNHQELGQDLALLLPYIGAAVLVFLAGLLSYAALPHPAARRLLWLYYLCGPAYLLFNLLRPLELLMLDRPAGFTLFLLLFLILLYWLQARFSASNARGLFAWLSAALLIADTVQVAPVFLQGNTPASDSRPPQMPADAGSRRPNIYHIVLDEFQSSYFDALLDAQLMQTLPGFVYYSDAAAAYDKTSWSIPSVFLGEEYNFQESPQDYQRRAFNGPHSALKAIREAGYETHAYTRQMYPMALEYIDSMHPHSLNINTARSDNGQAFAALWVYASLPGFMTEFLSRHDILIDSKSLQDLEARTFLADSAPQESLLSFRNYLQQEASLAAHTRYTYIHLLLPHPPYIYDSNCIASESGGAVSQSGCAMRLIQELIRVLQELQRYDSSLLIVHGDHGSRSPTAEGGLKAGDWRSPYSLLLVKPPGSQAQFQQSERPISLLSLAGLLKQFAGLPPAESGTAVRILEDLATANPRRFYSVVRGEYWITRHEILDGKLQLPELGRQSIPLLPPKSAAINAERSRLLLPGADYEAEHGELSSSVSRRSDLPGVSGEYLVNGSKTYRLELKKAQTVSVEARVLTPNQNSDSSFLRLHGRRPLTWHMGISTQWQWVRSPKKWRLPAGVHSFSLEYREPVYLDQIRIITH